MFTFGTFALGRNLFLIPFGAFAPGRKVAIVRCGVCAYGAGLIANPDLSGVEIYQPGDSSLAYGAEIRAFIGAHATILHGTIHAFQGISGPFVHADTLAIVLCGGCGHGRSFLYHVCPFVAEAGQRRDIRLPRLNVVRINRNLLEVVSVFVCQSGETVAKFMNNQRIGEPVVRHRHVLGIENAASAIVVGVDEDNDVFVGNAGK